MPKRTNDFQTLIALIHEQLGEAHQVAESVIIEDRQGIKLEVDILIEASIQGIPVAIAIECTDRSRKSSIEWINCLIGKYTDVPRINKVIAVNTQGFSEAAKQRALANGILTRSLEDAESTDWNDFVSLMTVRLQTVVGPHLKEVKLVMQADDITGVTWPPVTPDAGFFNAKTDLPMSFLEFFKASVFENHEGVHNMARELPPGEHTVFLETGLIEGAYIKDVDGKRFDISHFEVLMSITKLYQEIALKPSKYDEHYVASANIDDELGNLTTLALISKDETFSAKARVRKTETKTKEVPLGYMLIRGPDGTVLHRAQVNPPEFAAGTCSIRVVGSKQAARKTVEQEKSQMDD